MRTVTPDLQLGVEINPGVQEFGPLLNWTVARETATAPMLNFGTSSDRIGTPSGTRSYYLTAAKSLQQWSIVPYASIAYSTFEEKVLFPFGVGIHLGEKWVLTPMNDGRKSHLMLTHRGEDMSVSLLWIWLRHPGVSVSWGF